MVTQKKITYVLSSTHHTKQSIQQTSCPQKWWAVFFAIIHRRRRYCRCGCCRSGVFPCSVWCHSHKIYLFFYIFIIFLYFFMCFEPNDDFRYTHVVFCNFNVWNRQSLHMSPSSNSSETINYWLCASVFFFVSSLVSFDGFTCKLIIVGNESDLSSVLSVDFFSLCFFIQVYTIP